MSFQSCLSSFLQKWIITCYTEVFFSQLMSKCNSLFFFEWYSQCYLGWYALFRFCCVWSVGMKDDYKGAWSELSSDSVLISLLYWYRNKALLFLPFLQTDYIRNPAVMSLIHIAFQCFSCCNIICLNWFLSSADLYLYKVDFTFLRCFSPRFCSHLISDALSVMLLQSWYQFVSTLH